MLKIEYTDSASHEIFLVTRQLMFLRTLVRRGVVIPEHQKSFEDRLNSLSNRMYNVRERHQ